MISSSGNMTKQSSPKIHSCEDNDAPADDNSTPEERPPDGDGPDEDNKQPEINEAAGQKRDDEEGRKTIIFNPICGAVI